MIFVDKQKLIQVERIGQKYGLEFILLYGSQAKGEPLTKETDLDLAIYKKGGIVASDYFKLYLKLSDIFRGQNLDLKTLAGTDPLLRFQIIKHGIPLFIKDQTFYHQFYSTAYKDFHDSQSLFDLMRLMQEKRQKSLETKYA